MCPSVPFGGVGMSGTGREGGAAGLAEFYLPKNVFVGF
jgi:acyl-CoA reductase-like NAD-dependent aldehyde dehydrogenase